MKFGDININENVKQALSDVIDSGRLPHTIILEGGSPQKRLSLARLIAKAALCKGEGEYPCGKCPSCVKSDSGSHPDIMEIVGGEAARSFHIDRIREIRRDAFILPNEATCKAYILVNAQSLTAEAQNSLLKIIEEPPKFVLFIFVCTSRSMLLQTVLSRSAVFNLGAAEQGGNLTPERLEQARELASGIAYAMCEPNEYELLKKTAAFEKDKELLSACLPELRLIIRDALIIRNGGEPVSCSPQAAEKLSKQFTCEKLLTLSENINILKDSMNKNANHNLLITRLCSKLRV